MNDLIKLLKIRLENITDEEAKVLLSNIDTKEKIINQKRHNLTSFFQEFDKKYILQFFDLKTIELISNSEFVDTHINGMLTSGNPVLPILFGNEIFCDLIYSNAQHITVHTIGLDEKAHELFCDYLLKNNYDEVLNSFLQNSSEENQLNFIKKYNYRLDLFPKILLSLKDEVISYILNNLITPNNVEIYNKITLKELNYRNIKLPDFLLSGEFLNKLVTNYNFLEYRAIVEKLSKNNDTTELEIKRKAFIDKLISTISVEKYMFQSYVDMLENATHKESLDQKDFLANPDLYSFVRSLKWEDQLDKAEEFLVQDTNMLVSHMIIDYHFGDYSYNVLKEINNILEYVKSSGFELSKLQIDLYEQILNIENLSLEEKIELHKLMKTYNQQEALYYIISHIKKHSYNSMKEEMINDSNYKKYLNGELTNKLGVEVLELNGQPFRMLIKSFRTKTDSKYLQGEMTGNATEGGSYSYIGNEKLATFYHPQEHYNFVFTDFDPNNVVHIYENDSFSGYTHSGNLKRDEAATTKINRLMTPTDIIKSGTDFNEVIIAQKTDHDELKHIKSNPKIKFILCYDEITENQLESAKNLGLGIILVRTKNYSKDINENATHPLLSSDNDAQNMYYIYNDTTLDKCREKLIEELIKKDEKLRNIA